MTLLNPRLLLVTEDPALARTLSWVLKENGYDIVTAVGTVQLHERLEQEIYDLLVIDVGNGDAGAMTRLAASREHPGHRDTPLLVLADRQFLAAALDQFGLTAADLVQRPYRVRELLSRIKAHLRVGRELNRARARRAFTQRAGGDPQGGQHCPRSRGNLPDPGATRRDGAAHRALFRGARDCR
jgi:DNA-binding response OmpR family regulator